MADAAAPTGDRVFISYRREETAYAAGWLFDRLADHLGRGQIFKDVDSIQLGDDFVKAIRGAVASCDVLLALIGDQWLTITDEQGQARLEDPHDFVRLEIEAALMRDVRVIPILVEGARMPRADQLPPSLADLVHRQALELTPSRFDFDTARLLEVLDGTLAEVHAAHGATTEGQQPPPTRRQPDAQVSGRRRRLAIGAITALAVAIAAIVGVVLASLVGHRSTTQQTYTGSGGISVTTDKGWTLDKSSGIPTVSDYRSPGSADTTTGTYFRIGIWNTHPASSITDELKSSSDLLTGPNSPYRNVKIVHKQQTGNTCGAPSAGIDFTETNPSGVPRHAIQRLIIHNGVTWILELNTPDNVWDPRQTFLKQLIDSCRLP
jgi:hypothetical protein